MNLTDRLIIKDLETRGAEPVVIAQALLGTEYKYCPTCETPNMLPINHQYVCVACTPEYKTFFNGGDDNEY